MTSNLHIEGQTTKKYNLPLSHLEYSYIEKCNNVKELEHIVSVLRSGDEGKFPDLEKCAEKRLEKLNPKSHVLMKECAILHPSDLDHGDWKSIQEDLKTWTHSMQKKDSDNSATSPIANCQGDIVEVDENLPPVRSSNIVLEGNKQKKPMEKKKKKVMPRDYKEWDRFDAEAEIKSIDTDEKRTTKKENKVSSEINTSGMTEEEKVMKANREKDKGNEAFRSQDFDEALTYYSRSISLMPIAASYNNRALAYLKLKKWDKAIRDCNSVLNIEADNIKALMRRGTAYKSKKDFKKASTDLEKVLELESNNKKAMDLLKEIDMEIAQEEKERKERGGRRMVIEEVDSEDDEAGEEIEVDKPVVNGYGPHEKFESHSSVAAESDNKMQDNHEKSEVLLETNSSPSLQQKWPVSDDFSESSHKSTEVLEKPSVLESTIFNQTDLVHKASSGVSRQDISEICSQNHVTLSIASPHSSLETNILSCAEVQDTSLLGSLSQEEIDCPKSKVAFTSIDPESSAEISQTPPQVTSTHPVPCTENHQSRPQFIQLPLPPAVSDLKGEGNKLFRSGQYGEAIQQYSAAIFDLEKESGQQVNLSVLLSNRAACHLKTGNLSQAVSDCSLSLQLVPHGTKTLLRRAAAFEGLEKYGEAYVDYKHAISLDKSADQAHQGATRCQSMLQQRFGSVSWRERIPPLVLVKEWEVPQIVDQADVNRLKSSTVPLTDQNQLSPVDETKVPVTLPHQLPVITKQEVIPEPAKKTSSNNGTPHKKKKIVDQLTKEQEFEDVKAKGNDYVQKGHYEEAARCYSTCISLCPNQVACYTNRALCYLKLNKISEAETDCDKALSLQADNPKALYRRALARKMCLKYKLSLQDIIELLKLEPKNTAAQKEMDIVKKLYKEELEKLKKKAVEQEPKIRKRMKIEEVDDEDEEEKPRSKVSEKLKGQNKLRSGKQPQQSPGRSKMNNADKKQSQTQKTQDQGQPVAPPVAPRLMKTTPFEFCQAWNSLKSCHDIQPYADILRQISPADLPSVISNKLDGQMLQVIMRCVYEEMVLKGDVDLGYQFLDRLCHVPRFATVSMFMTSKEKKEVSCVLDILSKTNSSAYSSADIVRLKKEYSVK